VTAEWVSFNLELTSNTILPAVMILMGLFSVWVSKETVVKYLGKNMDMHQDSSGDGRAAVSGVQIHGIKAVTDHYICFSDGMVNRENHGEKPEKVHPMTIKVRLNVLENY
jgi:hypothetical protein